MKVRVITSFNDKTEGFINRPINEVFECSEQRAKELIDGCYKSFLDSDFNTRLTQILPAIEQR